MVKVRVTIRNTDVDHFASIMCCLPIDVSTLNKKKFETNFFEIEHTFK